MIYTHVFTTLYPRYILYHICLPFSQQISVFDAAAKVYTHFAIALIIYASSHTGKILVIILEINIENIIKTLIIEMALPPQELQKSAALISIHLLKCPPFGL